MNTFCPNLSNAQVRQEFNDLVQAVGEDQAYLVWHRNNGYALTSAPNGAESLLFQKLLEKYHGDYNLAMQKKAAMYLSKYTDQNGKWYEGKSKISLDENGEPLLHEELSDYQKNETRRKNRLEVIKPYIKNTVSIKNILPVIDSGLINAKDTPINKLYTVISDFFNKLPIPENLNVYYLDSKIRKDLPYYKNIRGFMTTDSTGFYIIDDRQKYFDNNTYLTDNGIPVFIHELTHALLSKSIEENKEFRNKVQNLYNHTIQYLKNTNTYDRYKDMYGFTNIDEFVSEAVSNVSFMRVLDNVPSPNEEKNSIFDEFLKVVKKLLKEIREGFSGEKHSVLDDVFKLFNLDNFDIYEHDQEKRYILEHAKRDENGRLLAPNGKPSNLTEKQYAQVRTKAFKEWFGDWENDPENASKVVDENGEPFVAYTGTKGDFTVFDSKYSKTASKGFFFTADKEVAKSYGDVKEVFLNIKNLKEEASELSSLDLENGKYDGISYIHNGAEAFVVWDSNQIKSATNNIGTFSRTNIDIYYLQTSGNTQDVLTNLFSNDNIDIFLKGDNTQQLLQQLINDSYIAAPFKPLAKILSRHNIPIVLTEDNTDTFMSTYVDKLDGVIISINTRILNNVSTGFAAQKLMHEIIHALTTNALTESSQTFDKDLNKATERLFSIYNKAFPKERFSRSNYIEGYNGLRDKYEFVSEFLTNQDFRNLLFAKAKELDSKNKSSNVLEKLRNFIKRLVSTFVGRMSNQEELQEYQMQLFNYINNKNAIVNGNIKSEEQLNNLIKAVDNYKFISENLIQNDELLQKLSSDIQKHDFSFGVERLNKFIQHSIGYQTKREIQEQLKSKEHRKPLYFESASKTLDETIIPEITKALETRLKAVKILDIPSDQKHQMISGIESQISALQSDTVKNINSIAYVLNAILPDILDEAQKIHNAAAELYRNGNYVLSNAQYMYEMHDYFGVYQNILQQIQEFFAHPGINDFMKDYQADNLSLLKDTNDFIEKIEICKSLCDTCVGMLKQICSANVIARLKNIGVETDNLTDMQDYIDSEMGSYTTHDISGIGKLFGSADASSDHLVRSLSYIVNKAASAAQVSTTNRVSELQMLQHNLKSGESVLQLYEKDENGLPTGYLVRKLNYGKFKKDYDKFMAELNSKYSTKEEPLDASNRIPPTDKENRVKWAVERNNWLAAHCHRQFNAEYYNKFAKLSAITKKRRDDIQIAINAIRSTVLSDNGTFYDYDKLSDEDWNRLRILYMQRRQLANIYDVSGEMKQGDDLLVAQEIKELNASLYDGNKAKRNTQKWKESRNKIIAECGGISEMEKGRTNVKFNWKKLDAWDERNSKTQFKLNDDGSIKLFEDIKNAKLELLKKYKFTDKQIEELMDGDSTYNQNKKRINEMIAPYRRLDNGEVDAEILPEQIKQKVIALQKENSKILKQSKSVLKKQIRKKLSEIGKEFYDIKWTQQFADMLYQARRLDAQNAQEKGLSFDDENTNVKNFLVSHGFLSYKDDGLGGIIEKFTPYQFYTKIVPKDYDAYMEIAPGDNYIEQDPESSFLDKEFDPSENETYIPIKEGTYNGTKFSYDNQSAYDKIENSKTLSALYDKVKQTIHETNEIYSNIPFKNDYQLPGITGTYWRSLMKGGSQGKWSALFKERFGRMFKTTEKDVDYQHVAATRPDGHQLSFIPQPYTAQLKDPTQISVDLVGIVSQYYAKGQNYKEKSKIKDDCETITDFLENRDFVGTREVKKGIQTNTYQMARKFLNMQLYNQQNDKLEVSGFNINKVFGIAKAWATMVNLGLNIKVATVGALSAFYVHTMNAICGREYGFKDWAVAMYQMNVSILESGFGARIIGQNSRLFQQNLMELFNIADQAEKKYKNTNRNAIVNQLCENWCFGMLTMGDWLVKGNILDATLSAHRFYKGKFLSKDDLRRKYADKNSVTGGETYQEALKEWKEGTSLLSVLKQAHKNGNRKNMFNIPSEYKKAVNDSFFFIQKRAQNCAARADGIMTPTQKAAFMTTMAGQALMMHKQYLQPMIQYYYGAKQYNLETQQYTYGTIRAVLDFIINPYKDGIQALRILNADNAFQSISIKKQIKAFTKGFASGLKTQAAETLADPINRQTVKRLILELGVYNLLLFPLVSLILRKADDDRDNTLLQLVAYTAISTRWEVLSQYRFADVLNTMKSPTAMTSVWDGLNAFMDSSNSYKTPENSLWNVFSNVKQVVSDEKEGDEIIDRGAYENWTKKERSLLKITPFKNLYEQLKDPYTKRKYVQNYMYKQNE